MRPASSDVPVVGKSRSRGGTAAVSALVLALVVVGLVASPGTSTRVQAGVGDSGVWVMSSAALAVGRVNTDIAELNVAVPMSDARAELVQSGSQVVVVDHDAHTATRIRPDTATPGGSITLPAGSGEVTIAGEHALFTSKADGRVWSIPLQAIGSGDFEPDLVLDLGPGAVVTTTPSGGVVVIAPARKELLRAEPGRPLAQATRTTVELAQDPGPLQLVATTTSWAALDRSASLLTTPAGPVDLSGFADDGEAGDLVLEASADVEPDLDAGATVDSVLVATRSSLLEVELETGAVSVLDSGHDGAPVRPVVSGGCIFAAWADGASWQRCGGDPTTGVAGVLRGLAASDRPVFRTNNGRVVLNDAASGRVWAPGSGNRVIDNWPELLSARDDAPEGFPSSTTTIPIAIGPMPPLGRIGWDDGPTRSTDAWPAVPPPTTAELLEPPPEAGSDAAADLPAQPPVPTPVTAILAPETGTVSLSWAPFGEEGDPVRGYFAQSLGPDASTGESPCAVLPSGDAQAPRGGAVVDVGAWTSGSFDGIDSPGSSYDFIVWGYNSAGCAASDVVTVTLRAAPSSVTAVHGSMVEAGTEYDYEISSIEPKASRYEVQRLDAAGVPAGDAAEISLTGSTVAPRAVTGGPFGEVYSFRIRACNSHDEGAACGPWTDRAAPEASLTFAPTDLSYSEETGTWSWSGLPENGPLPAKVRCGSDSGVAGPGSFSAGTCRTDIPVPADDAWIRIIVNTHSMRLPQL